MDIFNFSYLIIFNIKTHVVGYMAVILKCITIMKNNLNSGVLAAKFAALIQKQPENGTLHDLK